MSNESKGRDKLILIGSEIIQGYFKITDLDIKNYAKLYAYFTKNKSTCDKFEIDLKKGLWVYGEVGCGKTVAMKVFQDFCAYNQHLGTRRFSIYWFKKIIKDYENKETRKYISELYGYDAKKDICFDEFLKRGNVKDYGANENLSELIIDERYEVYVNNNFITHITTNCPPSYVSQNKLIDDRTLDRCSQMFNIIEGEGGSKR